MLAACVKSDPIVQKLKMITIIRYFALTMDKIRMIFIVLRFNKLITNYSRSSYQIIYFFCTCILIQKIIELAF